MTIEEAFRLYFDRLSPRGVLPLHSNPYLDLRRVVARCAATLQTPAAYIQTEGDDWHVVGIWMLLS